MYADSPRVTIVATCVSTSSNANRPVPNPSGASVTVSCAPNTTQAFTATFPAVVNGVLWGRSVWGGEGGAGVGVWRYDILRLFFLTNDKVVERTQERLFRRGQVLWVSTGLVRG